MVKPMTSFRKLRQTCWWSLVAVLKQSSEPNQDGSNSLIMFQGRVRILDAPKLPWLGQDGEITELHTAAEHGVAATTGRPPSVPKLENLPRPSFNLDMTQAEWSFKESQWKVYINQTSVSESVKVQQLKAACDEALLRRVHDAGGLTSLNSETDLLAEIRKLAVRVVHKTLHLQNMWGMIQSPEEPIRSFSSRLIGTADLCGLSITCSKSGCEICCVISVGSYNGGNTLIQE